MSTSIARHALIAFLLWVGFYVLALTLGLALILAPVAELIWLDRVEPVIALGAIGIGFAILVAIVPRPRRFEPPGPQLSRAEHPALFALIDDVARATGQLPPAEVYLVTELAIGVGDRGGFLGIGSRRVMVLGLPVLHVLGMNQFRAVIAHEFGHFLGGHLALNPWLYQTRDAIRRTLRDVENPFVRTLFGLYAAFFFRITAAVSREQEIEADALAARVAGAAKFASGLATIACAHLAFPKFWDAYMVPALEAGLRPSLLRGFESFLSAPANRRSLGDAIAARQPDPFDTHPPNAERLRLIGCDAPEDDESPRALTLVGDVESLEQLYLDLTFGERSRTFAALDWSEFGTRVQVPRLRRKATSQQAALAGVTPASLPEIARHPDRLFAAIEMNPSLRTAANLAAEANVIVGGAITCLLVDRGFRVAMDFGVPLELTRYSGDALRPFELLERLRAETTTGPEWVRFCETWEIADVDLGAFIAAGPRATAGSCPR